MVHSANRSRVDSAGVRSETVVRYSIIADQTRLFFGEVGELTRQWMPINRTAEYQFVSGRYDLVMTIGGSEVHSSR